uniref:COMM domain-containing protein n=2 Tax=Paramoeba aestuarina TaxID=180227 RepID=A0A7S4KYN1_9EUKA|mmetsp:Transcript_27724/g.43035  ORF Transcript_27724/g.43035 Transcript_27724/m.43035 type:complete len:146 (+) Transcript_27724:149-586(+)
MGVEVEQLSPLIDCYRLFFKQIIRHEISPDQIREDLQALKMEEEIINTIVNAVIARRFTAKAAAVRNTTKISGSYLADFDWKIHLNLGSDKISKVKRPSILLSLMIRDTATGKDEETLLELSPEELSALIDRLRELHGAMVQLRS